MRQNDKLAVVLDAAGCFQATIDLDDTTPEALASAICGVLHRLLDREASVMSCSVLRQGRRPFAMVMLRDQSRGGFLSGTASADRSEDAVVQAVLTALGLQDGVLAATAAEWSARDDVRSVTIIQRGVVTNGPDDENTEAHVRLTAAVPAPGRLAVLTEDTEYRILRFPEMAMAVSTAPGAPTLDEIDSWMAKAEALGP